MRIGGRCYQTSPCQHDIIFDDCRTESFPAHFCYFLMILKCMQSDPRFPHFEEQIGLFGRTFTKLILFPCVIYNYFKTKNE